MNEWFHQTHSANILVNGIILKEKAMEISHSLTITGSASNEWIDRFEMRLNWAYISQFDESVSIVSRSTVKSVKSADSRTKGLVD